MHINAVQVAIAIQMNLITLGKLFDFQNLLLDLRRKHVNAADDQHVIAASGDLVDAPHGTRGARQQARQVAGAVADHRQGFFAQ